MPTRQSLRIPSAGAALGPAGGEAPRPGRDEVRIAGYAESSPLPAETMQYALLACVRAWIEVLQLTGTAEGCAALEEGRAHYPHHPQRASRARP